MSCGCRYVGLVAFEVVGDEEAGEGLFEDGVEDGGGEVGAAVGNEVLLHLMKSTAGLPYGFEAATFAFHEEDDRGEGIEPEADEEDTAQATLREVLIEEKEVVAEVQEGLARVLLGQRTATDMIDDGLRHADNAVATGTQAPA